MQIFICHFVFRRQPAEFFFSKKIRQMKLGQNNKYDITKTWPCAGLTLQGKCFTYVTKTIANLTTYSRKLGDYNGTITFEIDIMKNSSPLNLKFTYFATVKTKITLLFYWTHSTLSSASKCDRVNQNKRNNRKICEKVKFDKDLNWWGTIFSWYQSHK